MVWKKILLEGDAAELSDVTPASVGTTAAAGSGVTASRNDHVHDVGVGAIDAANLLAADVVDKAALAADVAGLGLSQAAGGELDVSVDDSTVEISGDTLQVKALGIDTGQIANDAIQAAQIDDSANDIAFSQIIFTPKSTGDGTVEGTAYYDAEDKHILVYVA